MIDRDYMLQQPPAPSAVQRGFDQILLPALIDAATACERVLEQVAVLTRRRPYPALGVALGVGFGLAHLSRRSKHVLF